MKLNFYPEKKYTNIIKTVQPFHYQVTSSEELLAKEIFPDFGMPFVGACVSTGGTTQINLYVGKYEIPAGSRIVHLRWFREYEELSKAYDIVLAPIVDGNIVSVSWKKFQDHYKPLLKAGGLEGLIETNHLPSEKSGHLSQYGGYVPMVIDFAKQEKERLKAKEG